MKKNFTKLYAKLLLVACMVTGLTASANEYYWVGGTGNWSDFANHWATSSGGHSFYLQIPQSVDNVHFDGNSFTGANQVVTLNVAAACNNMDWTGATNNPKINVSNVLSVYGSLTYIPGMTGSFGSQTNFISAAMGNTITTAGKNIYFADFKGTGGWILQDAVTATILYLESGNLNTNSQAVTVSNFNAGFSLPRSLTLGASTVTITGGYPGFNITSGNMTVSGASANVILTGNGNYFYGGGFTYNDVSFAGTGNGSLNDNNTLHNVSFGTAQVGYIYGNNTMNDVTFNGNATLGGSNTMHNLNLTPGSICQIGSGQTETITGTLNATGTCTSFVTINSTTTGSYGTIKQLSGSAAISYVSLRDIHATGGAGFTASNTIDQGNNTGWSISPLTGQNLYWVGGTGNWNDGNHWSLSSGGTALGCTPTSLDNVHFDGNSFTGANQVVTLNVAAACNNMDWTGATNNPKINVSNVLSVYGSLTYIPAMTGSFGSQTNFMSAAMGNTITTAGKNIYFADFKGTGGWILQGAVTATILYLESGNLNTNSQAVTVSNFNAGFSLPRSLTLGASTVTITGGYPGFNITSGNMTVSGASANVILTGNGNYFYGGGFTYNDVSFAGTGNGSLNDNNTLHNVSFGTAQVGYIYGNNTMNDVTFNGNATLGGSNTMHNLNLTPGSICQIGSGQTETITGTLNATGTCTSFVTINSTTTGSYGTIKQLSGSAAISYVSLRDIHATGGAGFTASNTIDQGNNTGWSISPLTGQNLYWVGGTGNWNDGNHWSLSSGGTALGCTPTSLDNVHFDGNSFTGANQVVTLNVAAACNNMDWTGATNNPKINVSNVLSVYGSLTYIPGMTGSFGSQTNFISAAMGNTITTAGKNIYFADFKGTGGWILQDAVTATILYLESGNLNTNSQAVTVSNFNAGFSLPRSLTLGASTVTITGGYPGFNITSGNMTVSGASANVILTGNGNYFYGGGFTYNDVSFAGTGNGSLNDNNTLHNVSFGTAQVGYIYGNNTMNDVTFNGNGTLNGSNTIHTLTLTPGYTYSFRGTQILSGAFNATGTGGFPIVVNGTATISKASGVVCNDYLRLTNMTAIGGATFNAGPNSQNISGNTGWNFAPNIITISVSITASSACVSNPMTFTAIPVNGGGATYEWFLNNVSVQNGGSLIYSNASINAGDQVKCIMTSTFNCGTPIISNSNTITIGASPTATITAAGPTTFCAGGSVVLTANSGSSYSWNNGATTQSITVNISGNYTVLVTNAIGCVAGSATTTITVNPLPIVSAITGTTTLCGNTTTQLSDATSGGVWSSSNTSVATVNTSGLVTGMGAGTSTINYSLTSGGCTTVVSTIITVNAAPTPTISAGGPVSFCTGGSVTLTASAGTSYLWSNNATTQSISVSVSGNYSVTVTNANNCSATSATTPVTVNAVPSAPTVSLVNNCNGTSTLSTTATGSLLWSTNETGSTIIVNAANTYTVSQTVNGCTSDAGSGVAAPKTTPATPVVTVVDNCNGTSNLSTNAVGGLLWSTKETSSFITVLSAGTYTVTQSANGCTSAAGSGIASPKTNPIVTAIGGTTSLCAASGTQLSNSTAGGVWSSSNGSVALVDNKGLVTGVAAGTANISYSVTVNGCSTTVSSSVTVNALPTIASLADQVVCAGFPTTAINFSGTGNIFNWTNNTPSIGLSASGTGSIPSFIGLNNSSSPITANITVTPVFSGASFAYVPSFFDGYVSVANTSTNAIVTTIPVGANPYGVAVSPDGSKVYVTNSGSQSVSAISSATNTVVANIAVGYLPKTLAFNPAGTRLYVADNTSNTVTVINPATDSIITNIGTGAGSGAFGVCVSPDGSKLYATMQYNNTVKVIDAATNTITTTIPVGNNPQGIALSPDGSRLYITNFAGNTVSVINTSTNTVIATINVGTGPSWAAVTNDGSKVYVSNNSSGNISVIDAATNTVAATVALSGAPRGVTVGSDGSKVYVDIATAVKVLSTSTDAVINTVTFAPGYNSFALGNFIKNGGSGCAGVPTTFYVTVNPLPDAIITAAGSLAICSGSFVKLDANTGSGLTYQWKKDGTNIISAISASYTATAAGNYTVVVTNSNGCSKTSAVSVVTVYQQLQFTTCPSNISANTTIGLCTAVVNYSATVAGTPLPTMSYTFTGATTGSGSGTGTGSMFNKGLTTVTITAVNFCGSVICSFTVSVIDNQAPTVVTKNINVYLDPTGHANITAEQIDNGSLDNCGNVVLSVSRNSFDCSNLGANTVTLTAADGVSTTNTDQQNTAGGTPAGFSNVAQTFTAGNTGNLTDVILKLAYWNVTNPTGVATLAIYSGAGISGQVLSTQPIALLPEGAYPNITTAATYHLASAVPVIAGQVYSIVLFNLAGPFDVDVNTSGNPYPAGQLVNINGAPGSYVSNFASFANWDMYFKTIIGGASQGNGNQNTVANQPINTANGTAIVTVIDNIPPVIANCPANITALATSASGAVVNYPVPVATDNCSAITTRTTGLPSGSTFPIGTTVVTYVATDPSGNAVQCSFTVTISGLAPSIVCPANITLNNTVGQCGAWVTFAAIEKTAIPASAVTYSILPGSFFSVGTTTVTAIATNAVGTSSCTFDVTVIDSEVPTITAPANIALKNDKGTCGAIVDLGIPVTADNCDVQTVTNDHASTTYPVGTTTVTWTVTDIHGNSSTVSQTVTVTDNEKPVPTIPNLPDIIAECNVVIPNSSYPTATDNCAGLLTATANQQTSFFNQGNYTIIWTYHDGNGNDFSQSQNVIVKDVTPPHIINCVPDQQINLDATCSVMMPDYRNQVAVADNCTNSPALVITQSPAAGSILNGVGNIPVTFTVFDAVGLSATCTMTLTKNDVTPPTITAPGNVTVNTDNGLCSASAVKLGTPVYDDNCSGITVSNDAPATFNFGSTTVTWIAKDGSGNTSTATQKVTVTDNENPTITAPVNIAVKNDKGSCGATADLGTPVAADNCGVQSITNDAKSTTFPVGLTTITWTVTDIHGNTNTSTQTVTVTDSEKPVITASSNQSVNNIPGTCGALVTMTATAKDNCGVGSPVGTRDDGLSLTAPYPVGTTTVTWNVTDIHGNNAVAVSNTVTVTDNEAPSITSAPNQTQTADPGVCKAAVKVVGPKTGDNCGVASVTNDYTKTSDASGYYPVGTTTVTWTVTDIHGNSSTAIQTVTVIDNEKPTITSAGDQRQTADNGVCQAVVNVAAPSSSDNCGVASVTNSYTGTFDASGTYPVGTTVVTWTVADVHGNTNTTTQTIIVTDNEKPTITAAANVNVSNDAGQCGATVTLVAPATHDNCEVQSVTNDHASTTYPVGLTTVTWTVTDIHGNSSTATQTVTVIDNEKPTITAPSNIAVNNDRGKCSAVVALGTPVTADNCGVASVTNNALAAYPVGTTKVTWTVTDLHGNSSTATQTVTVTDKEVPSITAPANIAVNNDKGSCSAVVALGTPVTADNCAVATVTNNALASYPVGTTTVTYTVTDIHGNTNTATQTVTVTDNEAPSITSAGDQTQTADAGVCKAVVKVVPPKTGDNCGVQGVTNSYTGTSDASGSYPVGTTVITWTVTDIHGNTNATTQSITVTDNEAPIISGTPTDITVQTGAGRTSCDQTATWIAPTATDNCAVASVVSNHKPGDVFPVGTTKVTYTFTDIHGNSSSTSFNVIVTDNTIPTISTTNVSVNNDNGVCAAIVTLKAPVTHDNCAVATVTNDHASTLFPVGTTVVNWTVTDIHGNSSSTTQTVVVTDNEKPIVRTKNISVTLVNGTVSITPADVDNGSTDNCGIASRILSASTFICGQYGANTVTLTVTDIHGNVSSNTAVVTVIGVKPAPSIAFSRTDNTFTGLPANTIALGYGSQSVTMTATDGTQVTAGTTKYVWTSATGLPGLSSTTIANPVFTPTTAGTYVFTVTASNQYGCVNTYTTSVTVVDVRCGNKNDKVIVCHKTGSSSNPTVEICISPNAVATQLSKGDNLGHCPVGNLSSVQQYVQADPKEVKELTVVASPNPSTTEFKLHITSNDVTTPATVRVVDASGRPLEMFNKVGIGTSVTFGQRYAAGSYYAEVLQGTQHKVVKLIKML